MCDDGQNSEICESDFDLSPQGPVAFDVNGLQLCLWCLTMPALAGTGQQQQQQQQGTATTTTTTNKY